MHNCWKINKNLSQLFYGIDKFVCSIVHPQMRHYDNHFDLFGKLKNFLDVKSIDYILLWSICIFKSWAIPIDFTIRINTFIWNWCDWKYIISDWDSMRSGVKHDFFFEFVLLCNQLISDNAVNSSALATASHAENNVSLKSWS